MRAVVEVRLLGGFAVEVDGLPIPDAAWRRRRAAALVKLLALAPEHRLPRDQAMEALWQDLGAAAAAANLRKAAHHARRVLGVDEALVLDGTTVQLMPAALVKTDVARFSSAARDALRDGDVALVRQAAALRSGDLLPDDRYEAWCAQPREQLDSLYRELLVAGGLWGRLLELDPLSELAHREIVRERLESGDRAGALRQYDRLRRVLRDELGVSPDADSVALYERALAADGRAVPSPAERARALLAWGTVHWERSELAEAERTAVEARALAVDAGLGRELADASELLGLVAYAQGRWQEVFARDFLETLKGTPELVPFVFDANLCMSEFALHEARGLGPVGDFADQLLEVAATTGSRQARALGLLLRGEVALFGGRDPAAAGADFAESARLHEQGGSVTGAALATERLAQAEAVRGRGESASRLHRRALGLAVDSAVPNHLLPLVYGGMLEAAGPATATAVVEEAEGALAARQPCAPCSMSWHLGVSAVSVRAGRLERARDHLRAADRIAGMWKGGPWMAAVAEARALLRRAEGAGAAEVLALLRTAEDGFVAAGRPRDAARCRAATGDPD